MVIPRTILLAKSEVEELKELTDKDGGIKASASFDLGGTYGYSAVMALFSYEYERFDKEYARECADIAAIVYKNAESKYEEASIKEKRDADDKRYWAAAQLYKLTGRNEYKLAAEGYCEDPPKGFNRDKSGYLGTIAYLTCYNRIDLNVGELLITSLMDDINNSVRESFKEDFLACGSDEPDDREIGVIYEKARLMVLGNYISKNIRYVEGGENQVAYLYGRNMLGKDYAFEEDSEYYYEPMEFILAGLIDSYIYEDKKPEAMKKQ
jgi:endoglucanase